MSVLIPVFVTIVAATEFILERYRKTKAWANTARFVIMVSTVLGAWVFYFVPSEESKKLDELKELETPQDSMATESYPVGLHIVAFDEIGSYPDSTVIAGIKWDPAFADVRVDLTNVLPVPLSSLDIQLSFDSSMAIMGVSQISAVQGFLAAPHGEIPAVWAKGKDASGKRVTLPIVPTALGFGNVFRVYCPVLLPGAILQMIVAVRSNPEGLPKSFSTEPRIPISIHLFGAYERHLPKPITRYKLNLKLPCPPPRMNWQAIRRKDVSAP